MAAHGEYCLQREPWQGGPSCSPKTGSQGLSEGVEKVVLKKRNRSDASGIVHARENDPGDGLLTGMHCVCGTWVAQPSRVSRDWDKVTCKRCLKAKMFFVGGGS